MTLRKRLQAAFFAGMACAVAFSPACYAQSSSPTACNTSSTVTHVPVPINSTYKLVFDEEFNETSVNTNVWNVLSSTGMGGSWAQDNFIPSMVSVSGGFLRLGAGLTGSSSGGRPYNAGFIFAKQGWTYGYWEARAQMAPGNGMFPAFWMNAFGNFPEIDVFEWLGNNPNQLWLTYHPPNDATLTGGVGLGTTQNGPNYSACFHVYGMFWQQTRITWYVDGVQVFQLTQGQKYNGAVVAVPTVPMSTIFNTSVGGWNNNVPTSATVFPNQFMVDYLHIYSNSPGAVAVTPQSGYGGPGDAVGSGSP